MAHAERTDSAFFPGFSSSAAFCAHRRLLPAALPASRGDAGAPQNHDPSPGAESSRCLEQRVAKDLSFFNAQE